MNVSKAYRKFVTASHPYEAYRVVEKLTPDQARELLKIMAINQNPEKNTN
ncbi:hypothetical protein [Salibacterium aidingense]|nr:hypothetical protein [Salibacterium aidingense]